MKLLKPSSWILLALGSFFLIAAGEPQCARSSDRTLAPGLEPLAADPVAACKRACDMEYRVKIRVERKRHRLALAACNGDPSCADSENALHENLLLEFESDRLECRNDCDHQQGTGAGGQ